MLDIKYCFTCSDSDLSEIIKKCQNITTKIVGSTWRTTILYDGDSIAATSDAVSYTRCVRYNLSCLSKQSYEAD